MFLHRHFAIVHRHFVIVAGDVKRYEFVLSSDPELECERLVDGREDSATEAGRCQGPGVLRPLVDLPKHVRA